MGGTIQVPTLTGDVVLKVCMNHLSYRFEGFLIYIEWEVVKNTLSMLKVHYHLQVRPGTQPGQKVVLRGKGKHAMNGLKVFFPLLELHFKISNMNMLLQIFTYIL